MIRFALASAALAISGASAWPLAAQAQSQAPEARTIEGIVVIVNDQPISYSDVRERASLLLLTLGAEQPTQEQVQQITSQALDALIEEKLQLQEAQEYEVEVSDADIQNAIADMASQSGMTRENLIQVLLSSGVNPSSLEDQMRAEIAWRRIMGGLYGSRIRISENQIDEAIAQQRIAMTKTRYNVAEIFLYAPTPEEKEQALQGAKTILEQLRAGAPFELAAQRFSSAPTAAAGGDMGWVSAADLEPDIASAVQAMTETGITEPITVDNGVYIVAVRGKRDPADTETRVDLVRLSVNDGSEAALQAAVEEANGCAGARTLANNDSNLQAVDLDDVRLKDLGAESQQMLSSVAEGDATSIFTTSGTVAVLYVCKREESGANMPTRDQIQDSLFGRQLSMIAERSLRNLRRDATIIQRGS